MHPKAKNLWNLATFSTLFCLLCSNSYALWCLKNPPENSLDRICNWLDEWILDRICNWLDGWYRIGFEIKWAGVSKLILIANIELVLYIFTNRCNSNYMKTAFKIIDFIKTHTITRITARKQIVICLDKMNLLFQRLILSHCILCLFEHEFPLITIFCWL